MTSEEALLEADRVIGEILRSANAAVFAHFRRIDGSFDRSLMVAAAASARLILAHEIVDAANTKQTLH